MISSGGLMNDETGWHRGHMGGMKGGHMGGMVGETDFT